jgi:hypothetical protein
MEFIDKDYETLTQKTMYVTWSALQLACDRRQIPAPSYGTFTLAVHHRAGREQTQKRRGHRAAYSLQPFYWELEQRTPRHGDRPLRSPTSTIRRQTSGRSAPRPDASWGVPGFRF